MIKDLISKASVGRYFPFSHAELVTLIQESNFSVDSYNPRLKVILENCKVECECGYQLCSFFQQRYLAEFSLPQEIPAALGRKAVTFALEYFKRLDGEVPVAHRVQEFIIYRAYLASLGTVSVARHIVKAENDWYLKYRGAAQLSKSNSAPDNQHFLVNAHVI